METKSTAFLKQNSIWVFFMLTFLIGWLPFLSLNTPAADILMGVACFSPAIAGFIIVGLSGGKTEMLVFIKKIFHWKFRFKWYLIALLAPLLLEFLAFGVHWLAGTIDSASLFLNTYGILLSQLFKVLPFLIGLIMLAAGEEIGWRGYALPALIKRFGPIWATIILGIFWGLWHIPAFYMDGSIQSGLPLFGYVLSTVGYSFVYTCLHQGSKGSVLLASFYHGMSNTVLYLGNVYFPEIINQIYLSLIAVVLMDVIVILVSGRGVFMGNKKLALKQTWS